MAIILTYSSNASALCGKRLAEGGLVAFPTETVYGLGAHALNKSAVLEIFAAKGRPSTDPLIVHIAQLAQVAPLVQMTAPEQCIFNALAKTFWPGPLTLVVAASTQVPREVTAGKNSVGLRMPAHPVALELLLAAGVPVAAPSANLFGHVSPTTAQHVFADLAHTDVTILDGGACTIGIESTVLKICDGNNLLLLRRGAVSPDQILNALEQNKISVSLTEFRREEKSIAVAQDAPGQLLTHYAPSLPTFILARQNSSQAHSQSFSRNFTTNTLNSCVHIDFKGQNAAVKSACLEYRDLSGEGNAEEAALNLFSFLRWAENVPRATTILLPDFWGFSDPLLAAIFDRVYRSASGKYAFFKDEI